MIDKEKILAKIESLLNEINYEPYTDETFGRIQSLKELKSYIDSLPKEPVSEDLLGIAMELEETIGTSPHSRLTVVEHLVKAADWQKKQMMKDAIEREVQTDAGGYPYIDINVELYDYDNDVPLAQKGDKYKIVLIKE